MTLVDPIVTPTNLSGFPQNGHTYTNVTPFTYRDGLTFASKLEGLSSWIYRTLVPHIDGELGAFQQSWDDEITALQAAVNVALAAQAENVNDALATETANNDAKIAELEADVEAAVNSVINSSITVNDAVVKGILQNLTSLTRVYLDSVYGKKSDVDNLLALTSTGRLGTALTDSVTDHEGRIDDIEASESEWYANLHGVVADGVTDQSTAVNAFLVAAAAAGKIAVFKRDSVVAIGASIFPPSNSRINLNGATFKYLGLGDADDCTIEIKSVTNVQLYNGYVDGNKTAYAAATEWRHAIAVRNSSNIVIRDMKVFNTKGDGYYIGDQAIGYSQDVNLYNVIADACYRNGISISHALNVTVSDSIFSNTSGTAPMAGCDVEPNTETVPCANITFTNCVFTGNAQFGYMAAFPVNSPTALQGNVNFIGCSNYGNGVADNGLGGGVRIVRVRGFNVIGGEIINNKGEGIRIDSTGAPQDVAFTNVNISGNSKQGILVIAPVARFVLTGCTVSGNGLAAANTIPGIDFAPTAAISGGVRLIGNICNGSSQSYGLRTNANTQRLVAIGNDFAFNGTGPYSIATAAGASTILDVGQVVTGTEFAIRLGGRVLLSGGIAVPAGSTDVLAVAPTGTLAKKMRVWDDAGVLLGFVPLYPA